MILNMSSLRTLTFCTGAGAPASSESETMTLGRRFVQVAPKHPGYRGLELHKNIQNSSPSWIISLLSITFIALFRIMLNFIWFTFS